MKRYVVCCFYVCFYNKVRIYSVWNIFQSQLRQFERSRSSFSPFGLFKLHHIKFGCKQQHEEIHQQRVIPVSLNTECLTVGGEVGYHKWVVVLNCHGRSRASKRTAAAAAAEHAIQVINTFTSWLSVLSRKRGYTPRCPHYHKNISENALFSPVASSSPGPLSGTWFLLKKAITCTYVKE